MQKNLDKERKDDRVFVLEVEEGKRTLSSTGLVDTGLFKGSNRLHAKKDKNDLWFLEYEYGILPPGLRQKFTTFTKLMEFTKGYYIRRNVNIKEVID